VWLLIIVEIFWYSNSTKKCWNVHVLCTFMQVIELDQIYSRANCKKSNDRNYSTLVPNKILWISASFNTFSANHNSPNRNSSLQSEVKQHIAWCILWPPTESELETCLGTQRVKLWYSITFGYIQKQNRSGFKHPVCTASQNSLIYYIFV